jgi:hypothetical protein
MAINSDHLTGFAVGVGVAAVGFYMYKKNQRQVDAWLREQGIEVATPGTVDATSMSFEELVAEKEHLEDLIAEREMAMQEAQATDVSDADTPADA